MPHEQHHALGSVLLENFQQCNDPVTVDLSHKLYIDNLLSGAQTEAEAIVEATDNNSFKLLNDQFKNVKSNVNVLIVF